MSRALRPTEAARYATLYTGGAFRNISNGSRTGYLLYKFIPRTANEFDQGWSYDKSLNVHLPYMRLADVYLMYAEAAAQGYGSPAGKSTNYSKTAVERGECDPQPGRCWSGGRSIPWFAGCLYA